MAKNKNQAPKQPLQFAPSTFGQKAPPVSQKRVAQLHKFHTEMCDTDGDGNPIYPSRKEYIIAAHKAGYNAREIAESMGKKPDTVHSILSDERRRLRKKAEKSQATAPVEMADVDEEDELEDDEEGTEEELLEDDEDEL